MSNLQIPLAARINGARPWKPAKDRTGDEHLTGTVVAIKRRETEYGAYPCLIIDTGADDQHLTAFHAFHTVAKEQLKALKPAPGEAIGIVAHAPVKANKRKNSEGEPVTYTPYTIYNPDTADTVADEWGWDADDDEPGF